MKIHGNTFRTKNVALTEATRWNFNKAGAPSGVYKFKQIEFELVEIYVAIKKIWQAGAELCQAQDKLSLVALNFDFIWTKKIPQSDNIRGLYLYWCIWC